jgi:type VI protein secretion system component VasK
MKTITPQNKKTIHTLIDIALKLNEAIQRSMYDFVVTFTTLIVALYAVFAAGNGNERLTIISMVVLISFYLILLTIRILRRLDESWTLDEIGDELQTIKASIAEIQRNV